ncbi:hypothetical protein [Paenibacillus sp. MER TA 81-3]|nr:hypothetical protein [Paenibacillus sp. MER TA 81-3]
MIFHHGGINGFTSSLIRIPDVKVTVIVLGNIVSMATSKLANECAAMVTS